MIKCWCKFCGKRLKTKREYIEQEDTCDNCFKLKLKNERKCVLMGCDVGNLQSLRKVIEDKTNEKDIINKAKLLLKMGYKKANVLCQGCFWN